MEQHLISEKIVRRILSDANLGDLKSFERLPGGGNNQVYKVVSSNGTYLLKAYFNHPEDTRQRLRAEFSMCAFAVDLGITAVARPIVADKFQHLGLYEFIEGAKLDLNALTELDVQDLIEFFKALNAPSELAGAMMLPAASEAFFTLGAHLNCVEERLNRLEKIEIGSAVDADAKKFFETEIRSAMKRVRNDFEKSCKTHKLNPTVALNENLHIVSPSDFGFHNALRRVDGELVFIDFEYAGWDDAAKTLCDLYWQQAFPLSAEFKNQIFEGIFGFLAADEMLRLRTEILLPVYQLKWVSIVMNHFAHVGQMRRAFAGSAEEVEQRKQAQLDKARALLNT